MASLRRARRSSATTPTATQVRDAWLAERHAEANAAFLRDLRKRYRVVVAGVPND
jgi:hypothetical protein